MRFLNDIYLSRKPLAGFIVIGLAWACFFAQMPAIKGQLSVSDATYGAAALVAALGVIAAMWLAPLCDRIAGPFALPLGAGLVALGFLSVGLAPGLVSFILALTLASAGSGVLDVLINARVSEIEMRSGRHLMNLNHGLYSFAYAGSALLTGFARDAVWSPLQVFSALSLVFVALAFVMFGHDSTPQQDGEQLQPTEVPTGIVWVVGLIVLVAFLTESATEGWSALHIERTLGGGGSEGALGPALLGLTMGFGRLSGHALARFISDRVLLTCACLLAAAGLFVAGGATTIAQAYTGFALAGLGISVVAPVGFALLGRSVPEAVRLKAISQATVVGYAAFFVGPSMMGFVSQGFGLRAAFYLVGAILLVVCFVLIPRVARFARS